MIPQRLTLKNFLSYREASLDFRGLHTACICGANGAGKSSLLEAIAWAVWGESRVATEDDIIHTGAVEARVDFVFTSHDHTYRIIRSRQRGQSTTLDFQIAQSSLHFRPLTTKGVRATQQLILDHIKLDYDTFINSAYLRQGRADEFMLKRPSDRKQILADLLKLNQYDELAERAKDQARQFKGKLELLDRQLASIHTQLQQQAQLEQEQAALQAHFATAQAQQAIDAEQLQQLQALQHQRQTWHQQLTWQRQQQQILAQDCQRLQQELIAAQHQQRELETLLQQEAAIIEGYTHLQTLQSQEDILTTCFNDYQTAQTQRQHYQQQRTQSAHQLHTNLQKAQTQLESLQHQTSEIQHTLSKTIEVEAAFAQLQQARAQLHQLDQLQTQVAPLLQRRHQLQTQIDRISARLSARFEELQTSVHQLQNQQERQPHLRQAVVEVSDRIDDLERQRTYQQRIRDKGLERRSFMERLQAHQRDYETQLAEVEQKIQLLRQGIILQPESAQVAELGGDYAARTDARTDARTEVIERVSSLYPPCPLCDRPLDEHHWQVVLAKHQTQQQDILDQIWMIREQLAVSEREIQVLRQEYRDLDYELAQYGAALERRGQLQEQLQVTTEMQATLAQIAAEAAQIQHTLQTGNYGAELQEELQVLDRSLQQLNYDEKDHALARGQVDRWRWADIRHAEIKTAQKRQAAIARQIPELEAHIADLQADLDEFDAETAAQLARFDDQIAEIGYDLDQHNAIRTTLKQLQPWQLRYQDLQRAHHHYPQTRQRAEELTALLQDRQQHLHTAHQYAQELVQQLEQMPEVQAHIHALEQRMQQQRSALDQQLAQLGRLQQQQQQLEALAAQHAALSQEVQATQRQLRIYQELAQAFGRNGIQTLMIENVLPQLEAETNQILSRLSANQLHVQFVTQKANRKSKVQNPKFIETLDILIADARGTRPYETYSGGEAFRVNFAIRLALARLLAQRSGTALQMLIIDEGFGTQDAEGCDRLIAAINAIAPDFACILTVTHVPYFKEAFQSRIEVLKTDSGSCLSLML